MRTAMPGPYSNHQQQQQQQQQPAPQSRSNNKMASNASWGLAFPTGSAPASARQNLPQMQNFAQAISGPHAASLDLSDFPTLQTNSAQPTSNNPSSLWASSNARTLAQPSGQRPPQSNLILGHPNQAHHQAQQDELFASSSQLASNQSGFRFLSQNPVGQSGMPQQGPAEDQSPPLNRTGDGEGGQAVMQMQNSGFGGHGAFGSAVGGTHGQQANGLLNQLANSRAPSTGRTDSPGGIQALLAARSSDMKNRASGAVENDIGLFSRSSHVDAHAVARNNYREQQGIQTEVPNNQFYQVLAANMQRQEEASEARGSEDFGVQGFLSEGTEQVVEDPCAGYSDLDRYGIKGYLKIVSYPDQASLLNGIDIGTLGLDLRTKERISESVWSPFDNQGGRPDVPAEGTYEIPDCYDVHNVQSIENKIPNFSDETLFLIFYQNVGDITQLEAAKELGRRNWRYHKTLRLWLTKEVSMAPIQINSSTERGYYIFWNAKTWARDKREFLLDYKDLELFAED